MSHRLVVFDGDAYLVKDPSCIDDLKKLAAERMDRMCLALGDYECPFSILDEFDQWFEWKRREHFKGDRTGDIIVDMVSDVERIKLHRIVNMRFMTQVPMLAAPRFLFNGGW